MIVQFHLTKIFLFLSFKNLYNKINILLISILRNVSIKNKLFTTITIIMFILTNLAVLTTESGKTNKNFKNYNGMDIIKEEKNEITEFWAVLVGSDPYNDSVGQRVIMQAKYMKEVLIRNGWNEDNINLLVGQVTKDDVYGALSWLKENVKSSDTIFLLLLDHGSPGIFCLYDSGLSYEELDTELDKLDYSGIDIIIEACYSGSAIPYLQQDKRVIITSGANDTNTGFYYDCLMIGLDGFADYKGEIGDKNGVCTAEELFEYIIAESPDWKNYQMEDDYPEQLHIVFQNWSEGRIDQLPISHIYSPSNLIIGGSNNRYQAAQSFTPSFDVLTKVQLYLKQSNENVTYPITLSIYNNLTGDTLTSMSFMPSYYLGSHGPGKYVTFDFPDISVTPETTYYIVCNASQENESEGVYVWNAHTDDVYCRGESFYSWNGGQTWSLSPFDADLFFCTYGKNISQNFPPYTPKRPCGSTQGKKNIDYAYNVSTRDVEENKVYYKFDWGNGGGTDWIGEFDSGEIVTVNHAWTDEGVYYIKVKAKDENGAESSWSDYLRVIIDETSPEIKITKPEKAFYIQNKKIISLPLLLKPVIIGSIDIEVNASDRQSGINRVEFYIDDTLKKINTSKPYIWTWDEKTPFRFRHTIKVICYDNKGNDAIDDITVWNFL